MKRGTSFLLAILFLLPVSSHADQWIRHAGFAKDIGIGADGSVWVIGTNPVGTGQDFGIHRWTRVPTALQLRDRD